MSFSKSLSALIWLAKYVVAGFNPNHGVLGQNAVFCA
jgi:hypothetical protein